MSPRGQTQQREHKCPGECGRIARAGHYACEDCWAMLPAEIRGPIAATQHLQNQDPQRRQAADAAKRWYRKGWNVRAGHMAQPDPEHQLVVDRALDLLADAITEHVEGVKLGWVMPVRFLDRLVNAENDRRRVARQMEPRYELAQLGRPLTNIKVLGVPVVRILAEGVEPELVEIT